MLVNLLVKAFLVVFNSWRTFFDLDTVEEFLGRGHFITLLDCIKSFLNLKLDRVMAPPECMVDLAIFHLAYWGLVCVEKFEDANDLINRYSDV